MTERELKHLKTLKRKAESREKRGLHPLPKMMKKIEVYEDLIALGL